MRLLLSTELLLLIPCLPLVVARIEAHYQTGLKEGTTGVAFKEIQQYLADVEPLAAAA